MKEGAQIFIFFRKRHRKFLKVALGVRGGRQESGGWGQGSGKAFYV